MKQLTTFLRKELLYTIRTGRLLILTILFILFGVMSPAIAKLTPWLMEMMSDSLAETGIMITEMEVNALTSWTQFYKNIPIALIVFILMFSNIMTQEYQRGTLILIVTKGMKHSAIVIAKGIVLCFLWTAGYWLAFAITYWYNAYFWNNSIASNIGFSAASFYLLGLWLLSLILLFSVVFTSYSNVLLASGGCFLTVYLLGLFPKLENYLPVKLLQCTNLLFEGSGRPDYYYAVGITLVLCVVNITASILAFNRRTRLKAASQ